LIAKYQKNIKNGEEVMTLIEMKGIPEINEVLE
jgi:hypothetical protein